MATSSNSNKKKVPQTRKDVLESAIGAIRGKFGNGAIMRLGDETLSNIEVIPTGIFPLDVALGVGGYPRGRIVELYGPEGSGKTTVALHAIAEVQKKGGIAAFIDAEHALDPRLASALGVNIDDLYLAQPDSAEQALYILDTLVRSGAVDMVVVDSVAALTPQAEIDGQIGESQLGLQARLMSYALRRLAAIISDTKCVVIFINQLRALISSGYGSGPSETTTGGRALKFYASLRMEVRRGKKIDKGETTIGHELYIKVVKNKVAPPFRNAHASLIYGQGIPTGVAVVDMAIDHSVIVKKGSWLAYKGETLGQGKEAVAKLLANNPELQEEIKNATMVEVSKGLALPIGPSGGLNEIPDPEEMQEPDRPAEQEESMLEDMLALSKADLKAEDAAALDDKILDLDE